MDEDGKLDLIGEVIAWAEEKGIFDKATPVTQMSKTIEEVAELNKAVVKNSSNGIKDGIGDVLVTLIIQAAMQDTNIFECLDYVLYRNEDPLIGRTGQMIDGVFVKDGVKNV
jgi:NTP pyrophosphatase (non-canonical NTP hydrolase)